jgi:hypothetical protein
MAKWAGETLYRFGAGFTKLKNPMRASQKTDGKELFRSGVPRGAGIPLALRSRFQVTEA